MITFQGDGDYELVKDVMIDDYLWERIKKVTAVNVTCTFSLLSKNYVIYQVFLSSCRLKLNYLQRKDV